MTLDERMDAPESPSTLPLADESIADGAPPAETPESPALDFTPEEIATLMDVAKRRGFTNPASYLKQLVDIDADKHGDDLPFMEDTPDEWVIDNVVNTIRDVLTGNFSGKSADALFAELRAEVNDE
jgi:hypothetical protein